MESMRSKGFTVLELMIVATIIGVLAAIAIPIFLKFQCVSKGKESKINTDIVQAICSSTELEFDESKIALEQIANGTKSPRDFLSNDELNKLVIPNEPTKTIEKNSKPSQCIAQEAIIKELRNQINQLRQTTIQKPKKINQSWRE